MRTGTRLASTMMEKVMAETERLVSECRLVMMELQEAKQQLDSLAAKLPEPAQRNALEGDKELRRAG
jgi:hypothetical protein